VCTAFTVTNLTQHSPLQYFILPTAVLLIGLKIVKIGGKVFICNIPPSPHYTLVWIMDKFIERYLSSSSVSLGSENNKQGKNREKNSALEQNSDNYLCVDTLCGVVMHLVCG